MANEVVVHVKTEGVPQAGAAVSDVKKAFEGLGASITGTALGFGVFQVSRTIMNGVKDAIGSAITAAQDLNKANAQTAAVLASTGGVAGVTAGSVRDLAASLEQVSGVDEIAIQSAENLLLTFTKIGQDIFPQATATILDMSVALGEDMNAAAIQVGKALQDPIQGVTALRRVGVNFSEAQQEVLKNLVETGQAAKAQQLILAELNTEFGGSAKAAEDAAGGVHRAKDEMEDAARNLAAQVIPALQGFESGMFRAGAAALTNKYFINALTKALGAVADGFADWKRGIWPTIDGFVQLFRNMVEFVVSHKSTMIAAIAAIGLAIVVAFGPLGAVAEALVLVPLLVGKMHDEWNDAANGIISAVEGMVNAIVNGLDAAIAKAGDFIEFFVNPIRNAAGMGDIQIGAHAIGNVSFGRIARTGGISGGADVDVFARATEDAGRAAKGAAVSMNDVAVASGSAKQAEDALADARKELFDELDRINKNFLDKQIDAYLNGGQAALDAVKKTQDGLQSSIGDIASDLMKTFGIDLPTALAKAMDFVSQRAAQLDRFFANAAQERAGLTSALQAEFGAGAFAFNVDVGSRALGGGSASYQDAVAAITREFTGPALEAALSQLATQAPHFAAGGIVPGPMGAPRLAVVHGGESVVPYGEGGAPIYLNVRIGDRELTDVVVEATVAGRREGRL